MFSVKSPSEKTTGSASSSNAPFFQAKLTVNTPGDAHEQEADAVADQVMRMHEGDAPIVQRMPLTPVNGLMRKCSGCEEKEKEGVQRKETGNGDASGKAAPSVVSDVVSSGSGQPMESGTRQFMESRFGQDFSQVRIHTDARAAESASAIQARAYTSERDVVFGNGEYQPGSEGGRRLLAHELVHVGQQNDNSDVIRRQTTSGPPNQNNPPKLNAQTGASGGTNLHEYNSNAVNSAKGDGIGLALEGANAVYHLIHHYYQEKEIQAAITKLNPQIKSIQKQNPSLGILVLVRYHQFSSPTDSPLKVADKFMYLSLSTGLTWSEARINYDNKPRIESGTVGLTSAITVDRLWFPPQQLPYITEIEKPLPIFKKVKFSSKNLECKFQEVEWLGPLGFDDEGTNSISRKADLTFFVLTPPEFVQLSTGNGLQQKWLSIKMAKSNNGILLPAINLDPTLSSLGFDSKAVMIFPANTYTDTAISATSETIDKFGFWKRRYPNFSHVRWADPLMLDVIENK